ncbi:MAG TPA: condensation domain-containing protein, partial [Longimicrobium sp.]|nr:condensation domain-containing protein [Longimicrobium sp.]
MSSEQVAGLPRPELSPAKRALAEAMLRGRSAVSAIPRRTPGGDAPLSFAQERLWFLDRMEPESATYNIPAALRLAGTLDEAALERALGEAVRRHEALRTVFREVDGVPVQVIAPFAGFALPVEDLSGLGDAERQAAALRRSTQEALHEFDLTAGPLFRAVLLLLGAEERLLLLCMPHIVSDGWSVYLLLDELWAVYGAYRNGRESPLPELPLQYADFAVWQREQWRGETEAKQLAYWKDRLAGAAELLELPTDHPRPPVPSFRGGRVPVAVSAAVAGRLRDLARAEG